MFVVLVSAASTSRSPRPLGAQYLAAYAGHAATAWPLVANLLASAAASASALGCVNALLIYYLRVASIIVTIATSSIYYALLIYFTDGKRSTTCRTGGPTASCCLRDETASGDIVQDHAADRGHDRWSWLLTHLLMTRTRLGRQIYAFGGNPEAASRIGINILGVQLFAYGYLGLLAAIAGFIQAYRVHQAVPTAMVGQELNVLAVAILGGASLVGGIGTMGGVVLGVLFLAMLQNGLNLLGVSSYFFGVVIGLAILVSISMTGYAEKRVRAGRTWRGQR